MNNADLIKLVNYYYQLTTFALNMHEEGKLLNNAGWDKVVSQVMQASREMNEFLTPHIKDKICL